MDPAHARADLAAVLVAALTDVDVIGYPRAGDQPARPRVLVCPRTLDPPDVACPDPTPGLLLWCVSHLTDPADGWDTADHLVTDVVAALDDAGYVWEPATAAVWNDTHPAWTVPVTALIT